MNNFERAGSGGQNLGDFAVGSKGGGSQELVQQEQARNEKDAHDLDTLVIELKGNGREVLGSYMNALTPEQVSKIDSGLNLEGKGIIDLKWVEANQQDEVMGLLGEIDQAQDSVAVKNACKRIVEIVG